ncbi:MAG: DUF4091 domain-containing protein [Thermoflexales bacterium]|nr:DUF4091 domain-containing protein [Thermoflexales bacterium]
MKNPRIRPTSRLSLAAMAFLALLLPALPAQRGAALPAEDLEPYTYRLSQSTSAYQFWTAPPSERIFQDAAVPSATGSEIKLYAAQNEFEPFQLVVKPASAGSVTVNLDPFGGGITAELYQVKYVNIAVATDSLGRTGPYPDPLWPLENGAQLSLPAGQNTAFWFSVFVPPGTAAGDYTSNAHVGGVSIPVRLHVFNFAIPDALHVKSQMNFSYQAILEKYSVPGADAEYWAYVDGIKQYFIDHRLTPKGPLWPGGLTGGGSFAESFITYDCGTHSLSDPYGIWGFEDLAQRYIAGAGLLDGQFSAPFNGGAGYPSFMAASFAHNDPSQDQRPSPFCGHTRGAGDWLQNPTSPYNLAWFAYVTAMQDYLNGLGYLDEAYHYFANEPQDLADYDAVAWYSQYSHAAAPNLKLMVSEEPRPEIYDQPGAHVDIWLPVLNNYSPAVSHQRERDHGEESWVYFLHGTRPPYFNPITLDHPGVESKLTGWFLWKYRLRGLAYYSLNDWDSNPWTDPMTDHHNGDTFMLYPPSESNSPIPYGSNGHRFVPSIRFELMRDSLEDYEYLYLLAGGRPEVDQLNAADAQADKIITGLTSYTRNSEFMYNLRRLIGAKLGGEIAQIPDIQPPITHPRAEGPPGNYSINFQDPAGQPTADPLVVNGKSYVKIGWNDYDGTLGYGWYSSPDANWMARYLDSGPNELQRSIIYSDWGRPATFEFDLPNGQYNVTVSVGWQGRTYSHHKIVIEGISFINDEATTPSNSYMVRTQPVLVSDNKLTMAMGIFDEYTMLNYIDVEAAGPTANFTADPTSGVAPLTVYFRDASTNGPSGWEWDFDDDGSVDSTEQNPSHTYNQARVYSVRLRVSNAGGSDELRKEDLITVRLPAVADLGVSQVVTGSGLLTATLGWTPVAQAVTTTLRYSLAAIDEANWAAANLITDTLPGTASSYTAVLPYSGQTVYFALKSQNATGAWLGLSNLAFWPHFDLYLPLILR